MTTTDKLSSRNERGASVHGLWSTRIFGLRDEVEGLGERVGVLSIKADLENPVQFDRLAGFDVNDRVGLPANLLNAVPLSHGYLPCGTMLAAVATRNLTPTASIGARHGFR